MLRSTALGVSVNCFLPVYRPKDGGCMECFEVAVRPKFSCIVMVIAQNHEI